MRRLRLHGLVGLVALGFGVCGAAPVVAAEATLSDCDALVRSALGNADAYDCYTRVARAHGLHAEAVRRLEVVVRRDPPPPGALLSLASLECDRNRMTAEELYRVAIAAASAAGETEVEVRARAELADMLGGKGRLDEAAEEMKRAETAVAASDPILQAEVWARAARLANLGADYGRARELLTRAEGVAFPDGPPRLQSLVLNALGWLSWAQDDFDEALGFYERRLAILQSSGDRFAEAAARYNIALVSGAGRLADADREATLWREALEAAIRGGNRGVEASVHLAMGEWRHDPEGIAHLRRGLALATDIKTRLFALRCLGWATSYGGPEQRAEGLRWIDRALEEARAAGDRHSVARAWILRANMAETSQTREDVLRAYHHAFEAVEAIHDLQPEGLLRGRVFASFVLAYYRLSGYLLARLEDSDDPQRDVTEAFRASERLRARLLLDRMDAAGASAQSDVARPLHAKREQVLEAIVRVQRELMHLDLPQERRRAALQELARLEREESTLRERTAHVDPRFAALRTPQPPTPREVQDALADDEAFLGYQVWYFSEKYHEDTAKAWLYAITSAGVRTFPVPERDTLEQQVSVLAGLFENRDGSEATPAAALYEGLLGPALREMPPSVTRLVIVPDGPLCRLPFAALRMRADEPPLASRYEISYAPSATVWLRWRGDSPASPRKQALALADPTLRESEGAVDPTDGPSPWIEGLPAGRLPFARREAAALVRSLGGGSVRSGAEATEASLKHTDLEPYGAIVFATHAVVDDARPERSAILLAPGNPDEDGLLQFREIVDLDLRDRVVILSACRSAVGADLPGEGMMGLAHAFFQAGARAVIGSLWMLRDREQAELASRLARELARGQSLEAALAAAQRSLLRDGAPAAAWAGLVVLGDGAYVPRPGAAPGRGTPWLVVGLAGLLTLGAWLSVARWRRYQCRPRAEARKTAI